MQHDGYRYVIRVPHGCSIFYESEEQAMASLPKWQQRYQGIELRIEYVMLSDGPRYRNYTKSKLAHDEFPDLTRRSACNKLMSTLWSCARRQGRLDELARAGLTPSDRSSCLTPAQCILIIDILEGRTAA